MNQLLNQKGQAMIEALLAGSLSLLSLYLIFVLGMKIIQTTLDTEKAEEQFIEQLNRTADL